MIKRFINAILLIFTVLTSLVGCSSTNSTDKPNTPIEFSLSQYSETEVKVEVGEYSRVNFYVLPFDTTDEDLELVNSNEEVAECSFWLNGVAGEKIVVINIKGVSEGSTTMYLKDKNSTSQSISIDITVFKVEEEVDNSRTVYLNLNGEKYHYSKSCAGKSAYSTTLNKVPKYVGPCSKCVH